MHILLIIFQLCTKFFDDITSHKILMDFLFKSKQYEHVLDVYAGLKSFNIDCVTLAMASYYHIVRTNRFFYFIFYEVIYKPTLNTTLGTTIFKCIKMYKISGI